MHDIILCDSFVSGEIETSVLKDPIVQLDSDAGDSGFAMDVNTVYNSMSEL